MSNSQQNPRPAADTFVANTLDAVFIFRANYPIKLSDAQALFEQQFIVAVFCACQNNKSMCARVLGIQRRQLQRLLSRINSEKSTTKIQAA
jgi:DNA-binding NtrC family response regulator